METLTDRHRKELQSRLAEANQQLEAAREKVKAAVKRQISSETYAEINPDNPNNDAELELCDEMVSEACLDLAFADGRIKELRAALGYS